MVKGRVYLNKAMSHALQNHPSQMTNSEGLCNHKQDPLEEGMANQTQYSCHKEPHEQYELPSTPLIAK